MKLTTFNWRTHDNPKAGIIITWRSTMIDIWWPLDYMGFHRFGLNIAFRRTS